jgi:hypothetical protein
MSGSLIRVHALQMLASVGREHGKRRRPHGRGCTKGCTYIDFPLKPAVRQTSSSPGRSPVVQHLFSPSTLKLAALHDLRQPLRIQVTTTPTALGYGRIRELLWVAASEFKSLEDVLPSVEKERHKLRGRLSRRAHCHL